MHLLPSDIIMWVLVCSWNWFNVQEAYHMLESKTCKLLPTVMDDWHWLRIPREPGVLKMGSNMLASLLKDPCNLHKVSQGVNTSESKKFHNTM